MMRISLAPLVAYDHVVTHSRFRTHALCVAYGARASHSRSIQVVSDGEPSICFLVLYYPRFLFLGEPPFFRGLGSLLVIEPVLSEKKDATMFLRRLKKQSMNVD